VKPVEYEQLLRALADARHFALRDAVGVPFPPL
jgi:hypothetical protein